MWWIIGAFVVLGLICCLPDLLFYVRLAWLALQEGRGKTPPLAGA